MSTPEINNDPTDSATVILVCQPHRKPLEVFLARRHDSQSFMAGAFVFPGGQLEVSDADFALSKFISAKDDFHPQFLLQDNALTEKMALSFFVCAIRETFEETGVLFAHTKSGQSIDFGNTLIQSRFAAHRQALNMGEITLAELVKQEKLFLMPELLIPYSHWITPEILPTRFSTRFFLAELPAKQTAITDKDELTSSLWVTPHEALQMYRGGKIAMMPPTLKTLEEIAEFISLDELFAAARKRTIYPIMPQPMKDGLMLTHDPEYSIERYKQPARPGETSRFLFVGGKWQAAKYSKKPRV